MRPTRARSRIVRRLVVTLCVALTGAALMSAPASGHASIPASPTFGNAPNPAGGSGALGSTPPYPPNAFTTVSLRVPFEQTALFQGSPDTTVDVRVVVPAGWTNPMCGPAKTQINSAATSNTNQPGSDVPGWSCEIIDEAGHKVLHWSGPQIVSPATATESVQFVVFSVTTPTPATQTTYDGTNGTEGFIVDQRYASGETVHWIPNAAFTGTAPVGATTEVASGLVRTVAGPGTYFHSMSPIRLLDSRGLSAGFDGPLTAGDPRSTTVVGGVTGVPSNADSVVVNITATGATADSYLTAYATGTTPPTASNLNFAAGETVANLAVVRVGAGGQITFANAVGSTHVIVDLLGYYDSVAAGRYNAVDGTRVLDSRGPVGGWNGRLDGGTTRTVPVRGVGSVASTADSVVVNVTATGATQNSFLSVFPAGSATPLSSTVNFAAGQTKANLAVVKVGPAGDIAFTTERGSVDVIVDVVGYFDLSTGDLFHSLAPARIVDSRTGAGGFSTPLTAGTRSVTVRGAGGVRLDARALVANTTITGASADSYVTVHPAGASATTSSVNFSTGQTTANLVAVKIGANGQLAVDNFTGSTDVIMDVVGYFAAT